MNVEMLFNEIKKDELFFNPKESYNKINNVLQENNWSILNLESKEINSFLNYKKCDFILLKKEDVIFCLAKNEKTTYLFKIDNISIDKRTIKSYNKIVKEYKNMPILNNKDDNNILIKLSFLEDYFENNQNNLILKIDNDFFKINHDSLFIQLNKGISNRHYLRVDSKEINITISYVLEELKFSCNDKKIEQLLEKNENGDLLLLCTDKNFSIAVELIKKMRNINEKSRKFIL